MNKTIIIITAIFLSGVLLTGVVSYWKYSSEVLYSFPILNETGEYIKSKVYIKTNINEYGLELEEFLNKNTQEKELNVPIGDFLSAINGNDFKKAMGMASDQNPEKLTESIKELIKYFPDFNDIKILRVFHYNKNVLVMLSAKYRGKEIFPMFPFVKENEQYKFSVVDNQSFTGETIAMWSMAINSNLELAEKISFSEWIAFSKDDYLYYALDDNDDFNLLIKKSSRKDTVAARIKRYFSQFKANDTDSFLDFMSKNNRELKQKILRKFSLEQLDESKKRFVESDIFSILELGDIYVVYMKQNKTFTVGKDLVFFIEKTQNNNFQIIFVNQQTFWHKLLVFSKFNKHIVDGELDL